MLHGMPYKLLRTLRKCLSVPDQKFREIQQKHSNYTDWTRATVEYWLSVDPTPSWRRLVEALEHSGGYQAAVRVTPYMESLTGEYCICHRVCITVDKDGSMITCLLQPIQEGYSYV